MLTFQNVKNGRWTGRESSGLVATGIWYCFLPVVNDSVEIVEKTRSSYNGEKTNENKIRDFIFINTSHNNANIYV